MNCGPVHPAINREAEVHLQTQKKVDLATIHLKGKAETWYSNYSQSKINVVWEEFIVDLCVRFKDDIYDNVVEEFNKLSQTCSLEEYIDKFEELKASLLQKRPNMPPEHFLDSFIAGLRPQVKPFVKAFAPSSLAKAISFARLQEDTLEACKTHEKGGKTGPYTAVSTRSNIPLLARPDFVPKTGISMTDSAKTPNSNPVANSYGKSQNHAQKNPRFIPATVRAEKIAKGLCYYCDKPYERGHKCESKETHSPGQKGSQAQSSSTHSILGSVDWTGSRRCNLGMGSRLEAQIPNVSTLRARLLSNGDSMIQSFAILTTWVIALAGKGDLSAGVPFPVTIMRHHHHPSPWCHCRI
ncbi:unnamed protein product [Cuscuta campestris]|uniref:Retrotransposon gag domain-containing protein n=1 Tax=Cuscuta campestris TaxID=132261 RepID=A0A484LIR5_9ASTE|nr:unnamed protein product [Cuscuta campestris]